MTPLGLFRRLFRHPAPTLRIPEHARPASEDDELVVSSSAAAFTSIARAHPDDASALPRLWLGWQPTIRPEDCGDHDWRADPAGYVYTSMPPARRLVCARCGATRFDYASWEPTSTDPKDWPKA